MQTFVVTFETSEGVTRSLEFQAKTADGALSQFHRLTAANGEHGWFVVSVAPPFRMEWPE